MRLLLRGLRYSAAIVLLLLVLAAGTLGIAVSTEAGLKAMVALAQKVMPGQLSYERLEGRLLGPLTLEQFRYRDGEMEVAVGRASLDWQPAELLRARFHLSRLHAEAIEVRLPPPAPEPEAPEGPITLPEVRLPLRVEIDDVDVQDIRIYPHGEQQPIVVDRVTLTTDSRDDTIVVKRLEVRAPQGRAKLVGDFEPVGRYPLHAELVWSLQHAEYGEVSGHGTLSGDLERLHLTHIVTGPAEATLESEVNHVLAEPAWDARLDFRVADPSRFFADLGAGELSGHLVSQGSLESFSASGTVDAAQLPEAGPARLVLKAAGSTERLAVSELSLTLVDRPTAIRMQGDLDLAAGRLDAAGRWESLAWPLAGPPQVESPSGEVALRGTVKDYQAQLSAKLAGPQTGDLQLQMSAMGSDRAVELKELSLHGQESRVDLMAHGNFSFADKSFGLEGTWRSLVWPLVGEPTMQSARGQVQASGKVSGYTFDLDADLQGKDIPPGTWQVSGQGSETAIRDLVVAGEVLNGQVRATGAAAWHPKVSWQAELMGSDLDPGAQWPELSGNLSLKLRTEGELAESGARATLDLDSLAGTFRQQPVLGKAQLAVDGESFTLQALDLAAGGAHVDASGTLTERWDLRWKLNVPALGRLLPDAGGTIASSGRLSGPRAQPLLETAVDVRDLEFGDARLQRLTGGVRLDVGGASRSTLDFKGQELTVAGQVWETLSLAGAGTPADHEVEVELAGNLGRFDVALRGGLEQDVWQGRLMQLAGRETPLGDWLLEGPAAVRASAREISAKRACLRSEPTRLCLEGQWQAEQGGRGTLSLQELRLERFKRFYPPQLAVDSALSGDASASIGPAGAWQARADVSLSPGTLTAGINGSPVKVDLGPSHMHAESDGRNAQGRLRLDLGKMGRLDADARVSDLATRPQLSARADGDIVDLTPISAFVPQLQTVTGRLRLDLNASGTPTAPAVTGRVSLEGFSAEIPQVAIRLEDGQLSAVSDGTGSLALDGRVRSGSGALRLTGDLSPATHTLAMRLQGENFQAANSRGMEVVVSPDLELSMDDTGMSVEGQVVIPKADISAEAAGGGAPGAVTLSDDVVIVEADGTPAPKRKAANLNLRVRIILGDDIKVEAGEFRGKLKGNLLVEQMPNLVPRGSGTIEVKGGQYIIYGQNLEIRRGQIRYADSPLDNPRLDLDVARRIPSEDVLVGARVTGSLKSPNLQLYSEPSMPDASILSYLLFGKPPGGKGGSVTLGRYLTPDLYVSYGIGLFDSVNTFNLRYKLTERLSVQSTSSAESSGGDLLFSIER